MRNSTMGLARQLKENHRKDVRAMSNKNNKSKNDEIALGRNFLKSNWKKIEGYITDQRKGVPVPETEKSFEDIDTVVALVPPEEITTDEVTVKEAISHRKSRRRFLDVPLTLEELSFLCWATQGVQNRSGSTVFRTVPSAGARHSFETYLAIFNVEGVQPGLYYYQASKNRLIALSLDEDLRMNVDRAIFGQSFGSSVIFLWSTVPYRMEWRYAPVAHKIIALDAGHVCQNLYLACEAVGCGTCAIGAYNQEEVDAVVGLDGKDEFIIYVAPVGKIKKP